MFSQPDLKPTIDAIQTDVNTFVETELRLYLADESHKNSFSRSVIANIALFNIPGLNTEQGFTQISRLLGSHYDQMVERRIHQFLHTIYIRYGETAVDAIRKRVMSTFVTAYPELHPENLKLLDKTFNTFWLIPFIKEAYNHITLNQTAK